MDVKTAMEQIINDTCPHVHSHPLDAERNESSQSSDVSKAQSEDVLTSSLNAVRDTKLFPILFFIGGL